jgi:hypothetical protein
MYVVCTRYRLTEEERFGGYCTFDMSFVEYGIKPTAQGVNTAAATIVASETLKQRVQAVLAQGPSPRLPPPFQPLFPVNPPQTNIVAFPGSPSG